MANKKYRAGVTGIVDIEKIKQYMKDNKLSQKVFAEKCGLTVCRLKTVLSDYRNYGISYLFKIANFMEIPVVDLFN